MISIVNFVYLRSPLPYTLVKASKFILSTQVAQLSVSILVGFRSVDATVTFVVVSTCCTARLFLIYTVAQSNRGCFLLCQDPEGAGEQESKPSRSGHAVSCHPSIKGPSRGGLELADLEGCGR